MLGVKEKKSPVMYVMQYERKKLNTLLITTALIQKEPAKIPNHIHAFNAIQGDGEDENESLYVVAGKKRGTKKHLSLT